MVLLTVICSNSWGHKNLQAIVAELAVKFLNCRVYACGWAHCWHAVLWWHSVAVHACQPPLMVPASHVWHSPVVTSGWSGDSYHFWCWCDCNHGVSIQQQCTMFTFNAQLAAMAIRDCGGRARWVASLLAQVCALNTFANRNSRGLCWWCTTLLILVATCCTP